MARRAAFAKALIGRWRIVEMDQRDGDYLDLVEPAFNSFGAGDGGFVFGAVKVRLNAHARAVDRRPRHESRR